MKPFDTLHTEIRACSKCFPDGGNRPVVSVPFRAKVFVIGQAPSRTDSTTGRPFSGPSGVRLREWLRHAGLMDESDVYFSALTKCYPGTSVNGKGDRAPTRDEVLNCRPFLAREASCVSAELVLLVGGMAIREFLGAGTLASFVGNAYSIADCPRLAALAVEDASARWVVPLPHCSGASLWLNDAQHKSLLNRALAQIRTLLTHGNPVP